MSNHFVLTFNTGYISFSWLKRKKIKTFSPLYIYNFKMLDMEKMSDKINVINYYWGDNINVRENCKTESDFWLFLP